VQGLLRTPEGMQRCLKWELYRDMRTQYLMCKSWRARGLYRLKIHTANMELSGEETGQMDLFYGLRSLKEN